MIDNVQYSKKPQGKAENGALVNRLGEDKRITSVLPSDLASKITEGYTFKPAICGTKQDEWKSQEVFVVDIDDGLNIQQAIDRCDKLNIHPIFIYTTFSHTEDRHKFRIVFRSNKIITYIEEGLKIQRILNKCFDGDPKCKNLNRMYYGGREIVYENYDSVIDVGNLIKEYGDSLDIDCKISGDTKCYPNKYNENVETNGVHDIINSEIIVPNNKYYNILYNGYDKSNVEYSDVDRNIRAIKNGDIIYLQDMLGVDVNIKTIIPNKQELYNYIKSQINLGELLGINDPSNFNCIIHNDNNPSAGIFKGNSGDYIYNCFGCGFKGNIIHVIQALTKLKTYQVINLIKKIYNIEIVKTDWQKEQTEILETNKEMLLSGDFESYYPDVYKIIKRYIPQLIMMHDIAIMNVRDESYTDDEGAIVFFISNRDLASLLNQKQHTKVSQRNILFAYLKLLTKLDKDQIPLDDLEKALEIQKKYNYSKMVSYFSIGDYDVFRMQESQLRAEEWNKNNMSITGLSYEGIYRTFGYEVTSEIYPQHKTKFIKDSKEYKEVVRTTTNASDNRTIEIVEVIMDKLSSKRYTTESEVVEALKDKYGKSFIQKQIKRSLQEILNCYDLKRIRANKELKEKYEINSKGYPYIIVEN